MLILLFFLYHRFLLLLLNFWFWFWSGLRNSNWLLVYRLIFLLIIFFYFNRFIFYLSFFSLFSWRSFGLFLNLFDFFNDLIFLFNKTLIFFIKKIHFLMIFFLVFFEFFFEFCFLSIRNLLIIGTDYFNQLSYRQCWIFIFDLLISFVLI